MSNTTAAPVRLLLHCASKTANATIAAFADGLRQNVDLDELRERLLDAAQETLQPIHTSLWLRGSTSLAR